MRESTFQVRLNTAPHRAKLFGAVEKYAAEEGTMAVVYLNCEGAELQLGVRNAGDVEILRNLADAAEAVLLEGHVIDAGPLPARSARIWERRIAPTVPNLGRRHDD